MQLRCLTAMLGIFVAALFACGPEISYDDITAAATKTVHENIAENIETTSDENADPLFMRDGSGIYIIDAGDLRDVDDFQDILNRIMSDKEAYEIIITVKITGLSVPVLLEVSRKEETPFLSSVSAFDQTITVDEQVELYGNCRIDIYEADGAVVIARLFYDVGDTYVIWDGGSYELHPGETESVSLYADGGALKYRRSSNKFNGVKDQVGVLSCAFGRDDFLYEYGDVIFGDGALTLSAPVESFTISDVYDLDAEFASKWSGVYAVIADLFAANIERAK